MYFNNTTAPNLLYSNNILHYDRQEGTCASPPPYMERSRTYLNNDQTKMKEIVDKFQRGLPIPYPCVPGDSECPGSIIMRDVPTASLNGKKLTWALLIVGPNVNSSVFRADLFFIFQVLPVNPGEDNVVGYLSPNTTTPLSISSKNIWAVL